MRAEAEGTTPGERGAARILFIDTGGKHELELVYGAQLRLLSRNFCGDVVTSGKSSQQLPIGRFKIHCVQKASSKLVSLYRVFRKCRDVLKAARAQGIPVSVIISYDPLPTGLRGLALSWLHDVPLLVEINGDYTAPSNYADLKNPIARAFKMKLYFMVERFVLRRCAGIRLLYPGQIAPFARALRSSTVVHVYPYFLDVEGFCNLGENRKIVLVGFPFYVKGVDTAIRAFKAIAPRYPEWSLEILGWYAGEEKALLDRHIADHPQIKHHPPVFRREMAEYIGSCGVMVCSSRTEGFPRVIKEAMHSGKACIVSNVGGLPAAITHGINGMIFKREDSDELAKHMATLLGDPQMRRAMGEAAHEYALREFTNETFFERFGAHVAAVTEAWQRRT